MAANTFRRDFTRVVMGVTVIFLGVLFTLDNLRLVDAHAVFDWWPVVLVAIGLAHVSQNHARGGFIWSFILIASGLWLLGENLGYIEISLWKLSPLLLVALGASILWRAWGTPPVMASPAPSATTGAGRAEQVSGVGAAVAGDQFIKGTAIMGAFERSSASPDFRGGDLVAVMAGCKLDLRQATISGDEATLDVLVIMGGVELRIPENWTVHIAVTPLMGGVTDQTRPTRTDNTQRLVLRGTVFMGGVELKN